MWHTTELVKIFEKITEVYGYDIYQNRKLCAALCNDLFTDYSTEKNIMQMLFRAGLGEAMKGVPFKNERELKIGLSNIEKFLAAQAIEVSVRENVLDVIRLAFVDTDVNSEVKSVYQPVISKTFNNSHFKMTLPVIKEFEDRVEASFKFMYANKEEKVDSVLEKCIITDKFGKMHSSRMDYELLKHDKSRSVVISIPKEGKSVLIVSHSNVSVDGVIKQVVKMLNVDKQSILESGKILRFGYVRDDELSQNPYATSFNYALSKCDSYARQLEHLMAKRDELRAKNQMKSKEYDEVEHKIKEIRGEIRKEERKYVERAQVIGTTISRATIDPMFEERQFDLVMFDEVSMAYVPQVIAAAALAKEKFMCVGDFRQLAPISQSSDSRVLQVDIFSYLQIVDGKGNMYWHPWLAMLNEQRRMAPAISEFPSKFIYNRLLKDNAEVINGKKKRDNDLVIKSAPLSGDALNLINLAGTYCAADKNTDGSRFNILSAVISFSTAVKAEQNHIETVGIITPYAAQVRLIRAMLKDYYTKGTTNVSCATVHQFQGSESDVIVFDAVESYPKSAVGYLMGKEPNQVARLINVAITRGKGKVITVANARFWENVFKGTNHIFYKLLQHIKNKQHQVIDNNGKMLKPYIESVNPGKLVNIFMDEQDAISVFEQDMKKAKWQTVVSLPSGELRETEKQIFEMLDEADSRGIDIKMKSNDYAKLPEQWKKYCFGTENATFPLIVIDDEVAWYGLPTAKWKFQVDKTTSLVTVVHTMIRIKGKNTVEMLKALTDLENIVVGQNTRKLIKKGTMITNSMAASSGNASDSGVISNYGLGAFVEEKEFCPKCKNHMILTKNARGTAYLKCSNKACKETKYLTVDLMNWYINSLNVKCPKRDGGELRGGLGKYGPYVRCNCGHFLKPDEI